MIGRGRCRSRRVRSGDSAKLDLSAVKEYIQAAIASEEDKEDGRRFPALTRVARHLCVTPRTLQRRLREHGTTYRRLQCEVRLALAGGKLASGATVWEAAEAARYSEATCLYRAFKRIEGQTPTRSAARVRRRPPG